MADPTRGSRQKIPLKRFLSDYKSGVPDREIMNNYGLTARGLVTLIKTLMDKSVLSADDLAMRKQMTERVELVKEKQFLKGLFICPNCGHPHPEVFDRCPACGANPADYSTSEGAVEDVTTTGGHFYVDDTTTVVSEVPATEDGPEEPRQVPAEPLPSPEPEREEVPPQEEPVRQADRVTQKAPQGTPPEDDSKEKYSPFKSVRALISKIRKT